LFLGLRINADGANEAFVEQVAASKRSNPGQAPPPPLPKKIVSSKPLPPGAKTVELRVQGDGRWYSFAYRTAEKGDWISVADKVDASILSTHESGGFVGTTLGMFARVNTPPADPK
jgi:alpha-N-arabinofuranosidase